MGRARLFADHEGLITTVGRARFIVSDRCGPGCFEEDSMNQKQKKRLPPPASWPNKPGGREPNSPSPRKSSAARLLRTTTWLWNDQGVLQMRHNL